MRFDFKSSEWAGEAQSPDRVYLYDDESRLALNVAIATERPLLVSGPAGSGKSLLAANAAHQLGAWLHRAVLTSRSEAEELLWRFDALRRLQDAQATKDVSDVKAYVEPGIFWQVLSPLTAAELGLPPDAPAPDARAHRGAEGGQAGLPEDVILLDEIDKAEPELPNNLLDVLDARRFYVRDLRRWVEQDVSRPAPLVVLTTNRERALSPAFVRRCICLDLNLPDADRMARIAVAHLGPGREALYQGVARRVVALRQEYARLGQARPSTAEYLDALRACIDLGADPEAEGEGPWALIEGLALRKEAVH